MQAFGTLVNTDALNRLILTGAALLGVLLYLAVVVDWISRHGVTDSKSALSNDKTGRWQLRKAKGYERVKASRS
jgi:hypothetical protein